MECPHCTEEVEIEPENGSVFECPLCASDFEVESNPADGVDYSPHFWGPALDTSYPEHCLDYIARVDGELPENRLIQVSSDSHSEIGGVVFMIIGIITIPVLIIILLVHAVQNSKKEYQDFFGSIGGGIISILRRKQSSPLQISKTVHIQLKWLTWRGI